MLLLHREECTVGDQRTMTCPPKGGLIEHETHRDCQENWAKVKSAAGVRDRQIHCQYNGVCQTNLAHLLPKKSLRERICDFGSNWPAAQILVLGHATLTMAQTFGPLQTVAIRIYPGGSMAMAEPYGIFRTSGFPSCNKRNGGGKSGIRPLSTAISIGGSVIAGILSVEAAREMGHGICYLQQQQRRLLLAGLH